jgi:hypothetical protein
MLVWNKESAGSLFKLIFIHPLRWLSKGYLSFIELAGVPTENAKIKVENKITNKKNNTPLFIKNNGEFIL